MYKELLLNNKENKNKNRTAQLKLGKIYEQIFHKRGYPNGQYTDEKRLNLINHLGDTN